MDRRIGRQYADSFCVDSGGYRSDDRPEIWTDCEYHFWFGKVAHTGAGPVKRGTGGADRVLWRIGPSGGPA